MTNTPRQYRIHCLIHILTKHLRYYGILHNMLYTSHNTQHCVAEKTNKHYRHIFAAPQHYLGRIIIVKLRPFLFHAHC